MTMPEAIPDQRLQAFLEDEGYTNLTLVDGKWCGLLSFIFTHAIVCGLDESGYSHRYCYSNLLEANGALNDWIIEGGPDPVDYIKRKG